MTVRAGLRDGPDVGRAADPEADGDGCRRHGANVAYEPPTVRGSDVRAPVTPTSETQEKPESRRHATGAPASRGATR
jgi:hypothetical protein